MIRIALDVHHLRGHILGAVANRVDDGAAAHRAVRAGRPCLAGRGNRQRAELRVSRLEVKAKYSRGHAAYGCEFQEVTTRRVHGGPSAARRKGRKASRGDPFIKRQEETVKSHFRQRKFCRRRGVSRPTRRCALGGIPFPPRYWQRDSEPRAGSSRPPGWCRGRNSPPLPEPASEPHPAW